MTPKTSTDANLTHRDGRTGGDLSPLRGKAREEALLAAAVELLAEVGYERMTVDQIASRARASKATLYRRWPGKAEMVAEALRRQAEGAPGALADTGTLRGDLLEAVAGIARALSGKDGASLLGLVEGMRDDPTLRRLVRAQIEGRAALDARAICERAAARGEAVVAAQGPVVLRLAVADLLLGRLLRGRTTTGPAQEALVDDVLLPLLAPAANRD
jgi:AcrR family transcriptional regulator